MKPLGRPVERLPGLLRAMLVPALLLLLVGWAVFLRPVASGGPAGYVLVAGRSMEPSLSAGALVVTIPRDTYEIGEVVAFRVSLPGSVATPLVIHRIVAGTGGAGYITQGDNMARPDPWIVTSDDLVGRQVWSLAGAGPLLDFLRAPLVLASIAAGAADYVVLGWPPTPADRRPRAYRRPGGV